MFLNEQVDFSDDTVVDYEQRRIHRSARRSSIRKSCSGSENVGACIYRPRRSSHLRIHVLEERENPCCIDMCETIIKRK